jgi:cytochrome c2
MTPLPAPLVQTGREWSAGEIFWVVKYGIKMTGMPAWQFRMSEEDIWSVVALLQRLPYFSPDGYRRTAAPKPEPHEHPAQAHADESIERGRVALQQYACVACHRVPGITGAEAHVGPPLAGIASRTIVGGVLPNSPDNMLRWIREPQKVSPLTAMPDLGVTERDARDMAAYLATLR